jgi:hypothetical protein
MYGENPVSYMLRKWFAQNADSNSREREINCSKICNSNLPPIGDNRDIYPSDWNGFPSWKLVTGWQRFCAGTLHWTTTHHGYVRSSNPSVGCVVKKAAELATIAR